MLQALKNSTGKAAEKEILSYLPDPVSALKDMVTVKVSSEEANP